MRINYQYGFDPRDKLEVDVAPGDYIGLRAGVALDSGDNVGEMIFDPIPAVVKVISYKTKRAGFFSNGSGEMVIEVPEGTRYTITYDGRGGRRGQWRLPPVLKDWLFDDYSRFSGFSSDPREFDAKVEGFFKYVIFKNPLETKEAIEKYTVERKRRQAIKEAAKLASEKRKQEENQAKIAEKIAEDKKQAEAAQQLDDLFKGAVQ